ncbi:hypothetical protein ACQPZQ_20860 [Pseudonocardia sp. CA-142604]|uniref:hypothetical protein n=1 Tax=Pseudonocardia sp. CA-142604 TaxID=3240024 RepID=UPI003D932CAE
MMRAQHRQRGALNGIIAMIVLLVVLLPLAKILIECGGHAARRRPGDEEGG